MRKERLRLTIDRQTVRSEIRRVIREQIVRVLRSDLVSWAAHQMMSKPIVIGDRSRLHMHETVPRNEMIINLTSGSVTIGAQSFCGQYVALLAGTHDHHQFGRDRLMAVPTHGLDIVIGEGVWLASRATVLGPCRIGDHAVIAAGALVREDVPPYAIVAGVPARVVGSVRPDNEAQNGAVNAEVR
jgi:acetyltransferase-like isoleucine patch superfamily enzyme